MPFAGELLPSRPEARHRPQPVFVTIENQAAYLQGWLKQLRGDKKLFIAAAGAA